MHINLKNVKTGVFGIQGSGKTYLVEHSLIRTFKKPFVYLMHPEDFRTTKNNVSVYIPRKVVQGKTIIDRSPEHLDRILGMVIEEAKKGRYDAFVLDEASSFLPKDLRKLQGYPNIIDLVDNHRHYKLAFVYMARRPQAITTEITETSEYLFLFAIDGKNVKEYFKQIHSDYETQIPQLSKLKHNFILKELGQPPKIHSSIPTEKPINKREVKT